MKVRVHLESISNLHLNNIIVTDYISGYMLEIDQEKRPDIYQVSALAFGMAGSETPVANLHVSIHCFSIWYGGLQDTSS